MFCLSELVCPIIYTPPISLQVDPTTLATPSEQATSESAVVTEEAGISLCPPPSHSLTLSLSCLDSGEVDKVRRAKVLYRFEAEDPGDLTLEPGQVRAA